MFKWHYFDIIKILSYYVTLFEFIEIRGVRGGGPRPPPPSTRAPPERLRGGIHGGGSFNITSACISLPQARHSGVPKGGSRSLAPTREFQVGHCPPPGKYKLKRKRRLKINT